MGRLQQAGSAAVFGKSRITDGLSPRLRETLELLLAGGSEKEIAVQLDLSPHTVHTYVTKLYRRYGVDSRAMLMARFMHHFI